MFWRFWSKIELGTYLWVTIVVIIILIKNILSAVNCSMQATKYLFITYVWIKVHVFFFKISRVQYQKIFKLSILDTQGCTLSKNMGLWSRQFFL